MVAMRLSDGVPYSSEEPPGTIPTVKKENRQHTSAYVSIRQHTSEYVYSSEEAPSSIPYVELDLSAASIEVAHLIA